jgi:polyhydroxyalkanoate synthesis regulator phasin
MMDGWHVVEEFLKWVIPGIAVLVWGEIKKMRESVQDLNTHVAVILERIDYHEKRISKLENEKGL